jgi:Domain of unknown function (DUF3448).
MAIIEKKGKYYPDDSFVSKAHIKTFELYQQMYEKSITDPEGFWREKSKDLFWFDPPEQIMNYNFDMNQGKIFHEWFKGGYTISAIMPLTDI